MNDLLRLHDFDVETFLRSYWQQKPLLIKNPWGPTGWQNPLEPDELAGLAVEEGVESRLITQAETAATQDSDTRSESWQLEEGPLPETRFSTLGREPWTLLVQAVDHLVPDVAALIEPFRFIPDWRIDDVMVSYATDGAGVGAHYDQYDVFLIQGKGRRRWQVGAKCDENTPLLPHGDLRLLAHFEPIEEWVLEPGDILYVPPGFGHNGIALGDDCMTYSIGFRAPSRAELIADWSDAVIDGLSEDDRYNDPDPAALHLTGDNPGEITPEALERLHAMVTDALSDRAAFARWFGTYVTAPKYPDIDWTLEEPVSEDDIREAFTEGATLTRNPASRFSYVREGNDKILLFVNGEMFECIGEDAAFVSRLCDGGSYAASAQDIASDSIIALITKLVNNGQMEFEQAEV